MIAYIQEDGSVACCSKASSVPTGAQYIEVASVPDSTYREAWRIVNGEVVLDATVKANIDTRIAKEARAEAVDTIVVTTISGKSFDGDEISQGRMARAVASSNIGDTTIWVLADNTPAQVTHEELKEALRLAGEAQTTLWVITQ